MTDDIRVRIESKGDDTVFAPLLGLRPYLLIEVDQDDDGALRFSLTVGAGVPVDTADLADAIEGLALVLREGTVTASNVPGVEVIDGDVVDECQAGS